MVKWCNNDGGGGIGAKHVAGDGCQNPLRTWTETFTICPEEEDDETWQDPDNPGGGGGGTSPNPNPHPDPETGGGGGGGTSPNPQPGTPVVTTPVFPLPASNLFYRGLSIEQTEWWNSNPIVVEQISTYLNYDNGDLGFAEEAFLALKGGGLVDFNRGVIIDDSFANNTILMGVYNQIGGLPAFDNYLQAFNNNFLVSRLRLRASGNLSDFGNNPLVNAVTLPPATSNLTEIVFNTNNLTRPQLDIARTFIHELIHATLFRYMLIASETGALEPEGGMTQEQIVNFIANLRNDFPGIYDYYFQRELMDWSHEMMGQHYRNIIVQGLIEFDDTYPEEIYQALAWVGLKNTIAWNALSLSQRAHYNQLYHNFVYGN